MKGAAGLIARMKSCVTICASGSVWKLLLFTTRLTLTLTERTLQSKLVIFR